MTTVSERSGAVVLFLGSDSDFIKLARIAVDDQYEDWLHTISLTNNNRNGMIFLSLCTAYKSTVQTEQAMDLKLSSWGWALIGSRRIIYLWDSNMFYGFFLFPSLRTFLKPRLQCHRVIINMPGSSENGGNYL
jgi:hypothetical protein